MKLLTFAFAAAASTVLTSAAAAATEEDVTIDGFIYTRVNGWADVRFDLLPAEVHCYVANYTVPGTGYACDDEASGYSFDVLEEHGAELRVYHEVDGTTLAGDFHIQMNGPIPTILDQVGISPGVLTPV
ncbi:hypothetical protein F5Y15DRAFT_418514 [Xylariaceae sp. FL0016]|nr:hypothetical protein F5Y15DRAFT_418514 [Xylariaceae sp. FL0016]